MFSKSSATSHLNISHQSGLSPNMESKTFNLGCTAACEASMDECTNQEIIILSETARSKKMWIKFKALMSTSLELSQTFHIFNCGILNELKNEMKPYSKG